MLLVQVKQFGAGTRYGYEILYKYNKRVKTKIKNVFGAKAYYCRSYRGKTGRRDFFNSPSSPSSPSWIRLKYFELLKLLPSKKYTFHLCKNSDIVIILVVSVS